MGAKTKGTIEGKECVVFVCVFTYGVFGFSRW